ncbi:cell wall / vacuolar inhibitor of fructosidase 2-like [Lycium ferocissimum]|uniref:cell wall / vacuolar inhibitor of fructosidase 2-like n=1 Tax=Lycium ferocissimum TaxID=112874 RepID=UPI0028158ECA|nr:cell wall / vacuolar inhibitor of fructosidase 2-like [Lycium ferocissimum]
MENKVLFLLLLFLIFCFVNQSYGDQIDDICKNNLDPNLCEDSLRKDPKGPSDDFKGLAGTILNLCLNKAKENLDQVPKLAPQKCQQICVQQYNLAINTYIPNSIKELGSDQFAQATASILQSGDRALTCEDSCGQSQLTQKNNEFAHLVQVSGDVIKTKL